MSSIVDIPTITARKYPLFLLCYYIWDSTIMIKPNHSLILF